MEKVIRRESSMSRGKVIVGLWFVLLVMLGLPALAEEPDYGNDPNAAEPIDPNGTFVEGILSDSTDEDWFSFPATARGLYEISLSSLSGYKYMTVYGLDEWGELQQIASIGTYTGTISEGIFIEQRFAGTCYLKVYGGSGLYQLSVNEVGVYATDTYPDTCAGAAVLNVNDPPLYDGITDWGMDEDWFSFGTEVLHKYEVTLSKAYNSDVVFDLYSDDCETALVSNRVSMTFVSWYGAQRNLRLHSQSFAKEGYYDIWVDDLGEQPDDHGNTEDAATATETNGVDVDGVLDYTADLGSDEDWFSFPASAHRLYEITLSSQSGYKYMIVYGLDEWGELQQIAPIGTYTGTISEGIFIEQRFAGTCYLKVYGGSGLYQLSVNEVGVYATDTYPDTCAGAAVLNVNDPPLYDGITDWGMDEDWFSFGTEVLHKYEVTLSKAYNSDVVFDLYGDDCETALVSNRVSMTFVSWYGAQRNLRLHSQSFAKEGYYDISVDDLGEQPDDHGNTNDVATGIEMNGDPCEGVLQYTADLGSDEDWFSFVAPVVGSYRICLWSQSGYKYLMVYGLDEWGELQHIASIGTYTGEVCQDVSISSAGTYWLKVYNGSGLYQVSVLSPEPQCGDLEHPYPPGDVNKDCVVNFVDVAILGDNWLKDNRP